MPHSVVRLEVERDPLVWRGSRYNGATRHMPWNTPCIDSVLLGRYVLA